MARKVNSTLTSGDDIAKRPYIILRDDDYARHAELDIALQLAQNGHKEQPEETFIVCKIVAMVEPVTTSVVTRYPG